jgi:hypothetical protein
MRLLTLEVAAQFGGHAPAQSWATTRFFESGVSTSAHLDTEHILARRNLNSSQVWDVREGTFEHLSDGRPLQIARE